MVEGKQRILIIGNGGAGKSTFSKFLESKMDLEVYHLDKLFWKPNWQKRDRAEWTAIVEELCKKDKWIIEGNYTNSFSLRVRRADLIYFFDYSTILCLYGIYKRAFSGKFLNTKRADLADGCREIFPDLEFIKFVRSYNKLIRPVMYSILEEINFDKDNLIVFRNRREFKKYVINQN